MAPAMDLVRTLTLLSSSAMAVCMLGLWLRYRREHDWRMPLPLGYAIAELYVVFTQAHVWDTHWTWRTWLGLASSMVGWWAMYRLWLVGTGRRSG